MEEEKKTQINKQQIATVFNTKKGLHEFLTVEMDLYLPKLDCVNVDWLRDIWQGKKPVCFHTNSPFMT